LENEPLARHTTMAVGGPARYFAHVAGCSGMREVIMGIARRQAGITGLPPTGADPRPLLPVMIMGGGSNLIFSDQGYPGLVIRLTGNECTRNGNHINCWAGMELSALVGQAVEWGLAGLENLAGIPGTVGGAVWGNAGAFGASISDRITEVEVTGRLSDHDEITSPEFEADNPPTTILDRSAITFGYRTSSFQIDGKVILQVDFEFYPDDPERLARRVEEVLALRRKKHPSQPSAGSFFKNLPLCRLTASQIDAIRTAPCFQVRKDKVAAAILLDAVGARGMSEGGAMVSPLHANFIINNGGATSRQIKLLAARLKSMVADRFGVELQEEVRYVE